MNTSADLESEIHADTLRDGIERPYEDQRNDFMRWNSIATLLLAFVATTAQAGPLELKKGDHISFIGNTLAERMQHDGWLEAQIQSRFPGHELVIRNLGYSGDELTVRLRSAGFGSPDEHLTANKSDVVFAFFGYNESFGGPEGLDAFKRDLDGFIKHTLSEKYNGKSAPRLVLFSPIAHENLGDRNLPDGTATNKNLALYTEAMAQVARANNVLFVDLFTPTRNLFRKSDTPLTINGIHLTQQGNKELATIIATALFGAPDRAPDEAALEAIRQAVIDKNFYWYNRYRTVDGYSIYGGRADLKFVDGQTNRVVMDREMEVLDVMTANRDKRIWAVAQGGDLKVDDSNTPPFLTVKTNRPGPGPNGEHLFLGGEEAIEKMKVHKGLKVNLFASEEMFPDLINPVQMAFDPKGRLFVATWETYPHWKPKEEMNDKILILEDTDGDGKADKRTVFADHLHCPTGLEFWNGGLFVGQGPTLMFLKDTDGDDKADDRERMLHGLDTADTHHTMNSFTLDPGGALYFQEGTFHHTQVETPHGPPVRSANAAVYRYEPRTQKFEVYVPYSFANPHGHVFDRWGEDFVTDGTGNVNYFAAAFSGHLDFPNKHPGMQPFYKQWTRPCPGTMILSSRHFPDEMQGNYLDANVIGFQGILQYKILEKDSGFEGVEVEPIVQSADPNFRPVDMEIGADGALYFVDWQNPVIGHMQHNLRDPSRDRIHGRVYRVTYPGRPLLTPAKIAGQPVPKLLDLLKEPEDSVRYRTRIELTGRKTDEVIPAVKAWMAALDRNDKDYSHHMLEALWLHQSHNQVDENLLKQMLRSPDYRARAAATRVLCYWRDQVSDPLALLTEQVNDEYPRVRLEAVRACSFFRDARAADVALQALNYPMDYYLNYTLKETIRQLEPYWKKAIQDGVSIASDNPAGVDYLLTSVSTAELSKLPRTPLVFQAMLSRPQVLPETRTEALEGLARLRKTSVLAELLAAIERLDRTDGEHNQHVLFDLAQLLNARPAAELKAARGHLSDLASGARRPFTREIAFVALMTADGAIDPTWARAEQSVRSLREILDAVPLIPDEKLRASTYDRIQPLLQGLPASLAEQLKNQKENLGRFVRIELPRRGTLPLAAVQVFSDGVNIAPTGKASQSSTAFGGEAARALDGNTSGSFGDGGQTHTAENSQNPWWELDLGSERPIDEIVVWNRSEGRGQFARRLDGFQLTVLDADRQVVFQKTTPKAPDENVRFVLQTDPAAGIRRAAIQAIVMTGREEETSFATLAKFIRDGDQRAAAIRAIGRIPRNHWPRNEVSPLIDGILGYVGRLSTEDRKTTAARDALQLANDLAALLPSDRAQTIRRAIRELGVPVIVIRPIVDQILYDRTEFYVEAGKPVEVVFENIDIMPHNLVVTKPGMLEKVGIEAEKMAADPNAFAKSFIPNIPDVLFATRLLQPQETAKLDFTAPSQVADYPYVCTFPGHWQRMRGVMHVVSSLDDIPAEVLAGTPSNTATGTVRPFVKAWTIQDLAGKVEHLGHGKRDKERGKQLFTTLSCVQCHTINGEGGKVGPDLKGVKEKLADGKMTLVDVLTEVVEPSKVIDDKYRTHVFALTNGKFLTGIIESRNETELRVLANPLEQKENKEAVVIKTDDIDEQVASKVSLMPQGLLNTLQEDEILDLLNYVISNGQ